MAYCRSISPREKMLAPLGNMQLRLMSFRESLPSLRNSASLSRRLRHRLCRGAIRLLARCQEPMPLVADWPMRHIRPGVKPG